MFCIVNFYIFTRFTASHFYKNAEGENCPIQRLIIKKDECSKALSELGLEQINLNVNNPIRPAGCYFLQGWGYFNNVMDPESTEPDKFDGRAGVCKIEGNESGNSNIFTCNKEIK